jgi:ribosomal protein S18 acetylase RimI-like enzyme
VDRAKVPYFHLTMELDDVARVPVVELPEGFAFSLYAPGDEAAWARIEHQAGEFSDDQKALGHFAKEFGKREQEMRERCLFLRAPDGEAIGTSTAWYGERGGGVIGRLHWVAIVPRFQGRGLAKPLVSAAMALMRGRHASAYLTTQTTSWIAVKIYLDFGFRPVFDRPESGEAWAVMAAVLDHPALAGLRPGRQG